MSKLLIKTDPWQPNPCNFKDCKVCLGPKPEDNPQCNVRSITYSNRCLTCEESGKKSEYIGESSRTMRERYQEHQAGRDQATNHMNAHEAAHHEGQPAQYQVKVLKSYKTTMERQIAEAIKI